MSRWRVGRAVRQRSAKPRRRVRLPYVPPYLLQFTTCADDGQVVIRRHDVVQYNYARMMESVDMRDLKSLGRKAVRVQVPLCAPQY